MRNDDEKHIVQWIAGYKMFPSRSLPPLEMETIKVHWADRAIDTGGKVLFSAALLAVAVGASIVLGPQIGFMVGLLCGVLIYGKWAF